MAVKWLFVLTFRLLEAPKWQNGEEWPGEEGLVRFSWFPASLLPVAADGGGWGQTLRSGSMPEPHAQALAASCARHLLKNWLSGLSPLWAGSLPFHCVVAILALRNEYWLRACFSNWITGSSLRARIACPAPAALAATWIASKKSCLLEHLGITESCHRPLQWFIERQENVRKDSYLFLAPAACLLSLIRYSSVCLLSFFLSPFLPSPSFLPLFFLSFFFSVSPSLLTFLSLFLCLLFFSFFKWKRDKDYWLCFRQLLEGLWACFLHINQHLNKGS